MDKYFFELIASSSQKDEQQKRAILKTISKKQYKILGNTATNILKSKIKINESLYLKLHKYKQFIRRLSLGNTSKASLNKNFAAVQAISKVYIRENENSRKICRHTNRRMGIHNENKTTREERKYTEHDDKVSTSSSESTIPRNGASSDTDSYDTSQRSTDTPLSTPESNSESGSGEPKVVQYQKAECAYSDREEEL